MTTILINIKTDGELCGECFACDGEYNLCTMHREPLEYARKEPYGGLKRCQQCLDAEQKAKAGENALILQALRGGK